MLQKYILTSKFQLSLQRPLHFLVQLPFRRLVRNRNHQFAPHLSLTVTVFIHRKSQLMDNFNRKRSSLRRNAFTGNNFPSETTFSKFVEGVLNKLCYFAVSPHSIRKLKDGTYSIVSSSMGAQFCFYFILANSLLKVIYITYLCQTQFSSMEFLDKMSVALYFLVFGIMTISYSIWFLRYPLFGK